MAVLGRSSTNQGYPTTTLYRNLATGNLRDRGYSSSMDGYSGSGYSTAGNLTDRGYPSSTSGMTSGLTSRNLTNTGSTGSTTARKTTASKTVSASAPAATMNYFDQEPVSVQYGEANTGFSQPSFDAASAYNSLLAAYRDQESSYQKYLDDMRAAAQEAYDRGVGSLNSAYDAQMAALSGNLDSQKAQLLDAYNRSKEGVNTDAEDSLRQAYINNMLQRRNLSQQLSAMGINGGATETSLVGMANNYGNARNEINKVRNNNLYNLEGNYNNNLAEALRGYNSAVADINARKAQQMIDLENALANNRMNAMSNYQNMLQNYNSGYLDILRSAIANGVDPNSHPAALNLG